MKTPEQQHICSLLNCFTETKSSPGIISDAVQNMKSSPAIFLLTNMTKYANIAHEFSPRKHCRFAHMFTFTLHAV